MLRSMRIGVALLALVSVSHLVAADPQDPQDPERKRADALFEEARALIDAGKLVEGCAKFEESLTHDRNAIGTILNIAKCQARLGKIASAVATYIDVRDRSKLQNAPEYGKLAETSIAELAPFVPHLAITLAEPVDGIEVRVDDKPVSAEAMADLPLDPGAHELEVRAPHHRPYTEHVTIAKKEHKAIAVPALALDAGGKRFPTGMVVTIAGGGVAVTGLVIGLVARSQYNNALTKHNCGPMKNACDDQGAEANAARSLGNVGTVIGITGVVAAGVGTYLWLSGRHHADEEHVGVSLDRDRVGVFAFGRF